ncbi:MAG: nucleotidyltransferase domain-containing protein [Bacteroidetes bacterium]|nr:nucleotidyltransferase domain-containing protein [Bacteroidota bacterium]
MKPILKDKIPEIQKICKQYKVKNLYAYGSVCTNKFNEVSDIDLLVSFKKMPIEEYADKYFLLHDLFGNLFSRKIDLITENSISNPYFIKVMEKTKTLLYEG